MEQITEREEETVEVVCRSGLTQQQHRQQTQHVGQTRIANLCGLVNDSVTPDSGHVRASGLSSISEDQERRDGWSRLQRVNKTR